MKKLFFLFTLSFIFTSSFSQECEITVFGDIPSCPGDLILLSVEDADTLSYHWTPGDYTTPSISINPEENTMYKVHVFSNNYDCYDSIEIEVHPKIELEFEQNQEDLTCSGTDPEDCFGKAKAIASGAFEPEEYTYEWQVQFTAPDKPWLALGLCGGSTYNIIVSDSFGCSTEGSYKVKAFRAPVIEIDTDPGDTIFLQNPWIDFAYENLSIDTLGCYGSWDFGDSATSASQTPTHMYDRADEFLVQLFITDDNGCDTTYTEKILVKPVELIIPNAFTPNADGINDTFTITGTEDPRTYSDDKYFRLEEYYLSNELVVINRFGKKVFEANDYQNDWDGGTLAEGVYFYILYCHGQFRDDTYKGSVTIFR